MRTFIVAICISLVTEL